MMTSEHCRTAHAARDRVSEQLLQDDTLREATRLQQARRERRQHVDGVHNPIAAPLPSAGGRGSERFVSRAKTSRRARAFNPKAMTTYTELQSVSPLRSTQSAFRATKVNDR